MSTTTPLLSGHEGIPRVSALRGAMRFWFRALVGVHIGDDIATLRQLEDQVFGSLETPARVRMRIVEFQEWVNRSSHSGFIAGGFDTDEEQAKWIMYLLGQGHSEFRKYADRTKDEQEKKEREESGTNGGPKSQPALLHTVRQPRYQFKLKVKFCNDKDVNSLIVASLWLLCTYGGLGARTRRGFGGLRITDVSSEELCGPWNEQNVRTPGIDYYLRLESLLPPPGSAERAALDESIPENIRDHNAAQERPTYPTLSAMYAPVAVSEFSAPSWQGAAAWVGERYRCFRASEDHHKAEYTPRRKTKAYRAFTEKKNYNSPDYDKSTFPLGAFGLPVGFKGHKYNVNAFKNGGGNASATPLRRASPMWIRLIKDPVADKWRVFSFAFLNDYFSADPERPFVQFRGNNQKPESLQVSNELVADQVEQWFRVVRGEVDPTRDS